MQYIKNNAILWCSCGTIPTLLNVTSNSKIKNKHGLFATHKDNMGGINVVTFGGCAINTLCVLAGVQLRWINTVSKVKVMGYNTLLDRKSMLICPKGGIIVCLLSGQIF